MSLPTLCLERKAAIVTGGGSGIGQALAIGLARAGADVVVTELPGREEAARVTAKAVEREGRRAITLPLDVTRLPSIAAMVDAASVGFGRIDILVNNAGVQVARPAFEITEEDWDRVLDTDLKGVFFCSQAVGRHFAERGGGKIVNIASINGLVGYFNRAPYCSAKGGVVNLTRQLAIEWARYHINVNAVAPTYILTPLTAPSLSSPEFGDDVIRRTPLGRIGQPEDVVGAVVYLASPAADLVTGHTLPVDGGWTAW